MTGIRFDFIREQMAYLYCADNGRPALTDAGKAIYKRCKEAVERSFADAKELHGHRYRAITGWRGLYWRSERYKQAAAWISCISLAFFRLFLNSLSREPPP